MTRGAYGLLQPSLPQKMQTALDAAAEAARDEVTSALAEVMVVAGIGHQDPEGVELDATLQAMPEGARTPIAVMGLQIVVLLQVTGDDGAADAIFDALQALLDHGILGVETPGESRGAVHDAEMDGGGGRAGVDAETAAAAGAGGVGVVEIGMMNDGDRTPTTPTCSSAVGPFIPPTSVR